ncbi:hypothetical protein CON65_09490 [Bacillus pseudomycoides]|uniref:Uncharacterized protein n=1 Tax=Bacillus pseudomycoides TaxID=64104 RepID=A0AA91VDX4_9BACI|nr:MULTISPECIES: hypothetical protein [Bacillus]PEB48015.1 hypothetical protein COO03_24820 [Bacillus sp. AFS098217]PED82893.1 hypothetical protein CON65_09490 [Bacillus pseudomycoides]PEU09730.1 hypothetical protein CN524_18015 [Bacillus sp. AFS019443]PEU18425.1 hypothetical protein CN525_11815 [Bacillus sp. AFS014408]PFW62669.1 hypothetical protein COL20_12165 [Bacillus sp. AFS075034]
MTEYRDVYVLESGQIEGSYREQGKIYAFTEKKAGELIREGKAKDPYNFKLKHLIDQSTKYLSDFEKEKQAIKTSDRLTDVAKKEDTQALVEKYNLSFDVIQSIYKEELSTRLDEAKKEAGVASLKTETKYDPHKVEQEAGIITSHIVMTPNIKEVISYIEEKITYMDVEVAREVLSNFVNIKAHLDTLHNGDPLQSMRIRKLYDDLTRAATGQAQIDVNSDVGLWSALNDHRDDIAWEWRRKKQFMGVR